MYCRQHHCHNHCCPNCMTITIPVTYWCNHCQRFTSHHHCHPVWNPPVTRPFITYGAQQRDRATIAALSR